MTSEPLPHALLLADRLNVLHIEEERFHSTILWFTKNNEKLMHHESMETIC